MSWRLVFIFAVLIIFITIFIFTEWPDDNVHVIFCDVGQGDAVLIIDGFSQALVDTGPDDKVTECLEKHLPFWDKKLELFVITHPDADHIGGVEAVLGQYKPHFILHDLSGKPTALSRRVKEYLKKAASKGSKILLPRVGQIIRLGNVTLGVWQGYEMQKSLLKMTETQLWDENSENEVAHEGDNDDSIVLFGTFGRRTFLLTGDLEEKGELALNDYALTTKTELLKAGHHGSKTSSIEPFIKTVQPEHVVISSGKNNRYGHPAPEVMLTLEKSGAKIYRTDLQGDLDFIAGKQSWRIAADWLQRLKGFAVKELSTLTLPYRKTGYK